MSDQAVDDLLELLAIEGPPGREGAVAEFLVRHLKALGTESKYITFDETQKQSEYGGEIGNLIVRLDGHGRGPRTVLTAHMDTVPDAVGARPRLDADARRIVNDAEGKALGGDNRTGCAALLQAARALIARDKHHGPVTLVFFVQEEVGLVGSRGLDVTKLGDLNGAMAYNIDHDRPENIVHAVTGTERLVIDITGKPSHAGSAPARGISAALVAAHALSELDREGWHGVIEKPAGRGTANLGVLKGGQGSNVVMPRLSILAEARSHDPAFRASILEIWKGTFRRHAELIRNDEGQAATVAFSPGPKYESFALPKDAPVIARAAQAIGELGRTPIYEVNNGGMDANWMNFHGIPCLTIGGGQRQVHTPQEWIDLDDYRAICDVVLKLLP